MIVSNTVHTQQSIYNEQKTTQKSDSNSFDEVLQKEETFKAEQSRTEDIKFKKIERMSFEYIKDLDKKEIDEVYSDLSKEERDKIGFLKSITNLSENNTLNKVLFNQAKDMTPDETKWFFFGKAGEMSKYKMTGEGQRYLVNKHAFTQDDNGKIIVDKDVNPPHPEEHKLSHEEAFNFLLDMVNSSKEGMEKYKDELQKLYTGTYNEFNELLELYNTELRNNVTGANLHV